MGDGLDYPETLDDYAADKFTGLRPWSNDEPDLMEGIIEDECWECDEVKPLVGNILKKVDCLYACASCIQAFEQDDAPEELAITLEEADVVGRVRADEDFMAGCREGLRAYLAGDTVQPWEDVKRELGIE